LKWARRIADTRKSLADFSQDTFFDHLGFIKPRFDSAPSKAQVFADSYNRTGSGLLLRFRVSS
jgi:hypothetical protein